MKEFEYNGIWWLPNNPNKKISGILKFHPVEGATLDLNGSFKDIKDINSFSQPETILGNTSNAKIFTLYKCIENNIRLSMPGYLCSSFIVTIIFEGHHFKKEEDILFDSLSISYPYLEEWMGFKSFNCKMVRDKENLLKEYKVNYTFPQKIEAKVDNFNISFDYNFNVDGDNIREYNLKHTAFIKIESYKATSFNVYLRNICYHIQNFLSLAIGRSFRYGFRKTRVENRLNITSCL